MSGNHAFFSALAEAASEPYRRAGRFAHGFARGKLLRDPAFQHLLTTDLLSPHPSDEPTRILDIGCGQGLLASLLLAADQAWRSGEYGEWPSQWPPPPRAPQVHGIELMARDVHRAREALGSRARIEQADMRHADFGTTDVAVILDVLHYVDFDAQGDVLRRVRAALRPGGRLLLRVGDADAGLPFWISQQVDSIVTFIRGHRLGRLYCRSVGQWTQALQGLGFSVRPVALSQGTPFANVLLVAKT